MRVLRSAPVLLLALALAACAGDIARPVAIQPVTLVPKADLRLVEVVGETRQGVVMTPSDLARIGEMVRAEIQAKYPDAFAAPGPGQVPARIKMVFIQYDGGNAFARFMLAGLGQIHIEADVHILAATGNDVLGTYKVTKQFAFGGIYGGITTLRDVEQGFARSVADVLGD